MKKISIIVAVLILVLGGCFYIDFAKKKDAKTEATNKIPQITSEKNQIENAEYSGNSRK